MTVRVEISGLKELNRKLREIGGDLPKTMRLAFNEAADTVVVEAKPKVPNESGAAARSVRAQSTRTMSRVSGGGAKAPYYPWLDFGGRVGKGKQISRPYKKDGRYIYQVYFKKRDSGEYQEVLSEALRDVIEKAGLDVDVG